MKSAHSFLLMVGLMLVVGGINCREAAAKDIALAQVPEKVIVAAEQAVPGIEFTEAEAKRSAKGHVYELEGTAGGRDYEIKVSADGKVLKVKEEHHEHRSR